MLFLKLYNSKMGREMELFIPLDLLYLQKKAKQELARIYGEEPTNDGISTGS
jgi:hypothetical protein